MSSKGQFFEDILIHSKSCERSSSKKSADAERMRLSEVKLSSLKALRA